MFDRGDPDRMILWGQSAGANAVITYSYANPDDPIVKGLVADSGAAPQGLGVNNTSFSRMAAGLGCGDLAPDAELLCMQKVDAKAIQKFVLDNRSSGLGNIGGMVADNVTAFPNNTQRLVEGRIAKIVSHPDLFSVTGDNAQQPLITGLNRHEGAAFGPFSLNQTVGPDPESLKAADRMFVCGVDREAK